jgi:hypothetical protein
MQYVTEEEKKPNHVSTAPAASPSPDEVMEMCQFVVDGERRLVLDEKKKMMMMTRSAGAQPKVVTTVDYKYGVEGSCPRDRNELKLVSLHLHLPDKDRKTTSNDKLVTVCKVWKWKKEKQPYALIDAEAGILIYFLF